MNKYDRDDYGDEFYTDKRRPASINNLINY